jgi:hypothetical protein
MGTFDASTRCVLLTELFSGLSLPGGVKNFMLVNQHGKLARDLGQSTLNFFHPGVVQPSGFFAGAT